MEYKLSSASKWILEKYIELEVAVNRHVKAMELAHAIDEIYTFVWDYYADWYVEYLKTDNTQIPFATELYRQLIVTIAPFVPFETEAIWKEFFGSQTLLAKTNKDFEWSQIVNTQNNEADSSSFEIIKDAVEKLRSLRGLFQLDPTIKLECQTENKTLLENTEFIASIARTSLVYGSAGSYEMKGNKWSMFLNIVDYIKDVPNQIAYTDKLIQNLSKQISQLESQLSNEAFLLNAEKEAIEQKRLDLNSRMIELNSQEIKKSFLIANIS